MSCARAEGGRGRSMGRSGVETGALLALYPDSPAPCTRTLPLFRSFVMPSPRPMIGYARLRGRHANLPLPNDTSTPKRSSLVFKDT